MEGTERRRLLISGRVQGVFFRGGLRKVAMVHAVNGWTRNLDDGRVEVVIEGHGEAIERVIDWCRVGPPDACIDNVEIIDEPVVGESGFIIL
jgi:acylphosphatase